MLAGTSTTWPTPSEEALKTLTKYQSTPGVTRYFCGTCGTPVLSISDTYTVATGAIDLDDTNEFLRYESHIFVADTKDGGMSNWLRQVGGRPIERWREQSNGTELPLGWSIHDEEVLGHSRSPREVQEQLYAHCLCKGIEFLVSRPDVNSHEEDHWSRDADLADFLNVKDQKWTAVTCVCRSCRRSTGNDIPAYFQIAMSHVSQLDGSPFNLSFGTLRSYQSSPDVTRTFCGKCGASAFYYSNARQKSVDVPVGLLDSTAGARAEDWLRWTLPVGYEEEAPHRELLESLKEGLEASYGETQSDIK
jgi:hypothetical protein